MENLVSTDQIGIIDVRLAKIGVKSHSYTTDGIQFIGLCMPINILGLKSQEETSRMFQID